MKYMFTLTFCLLTACGTDDVVNVQCPESDCVPTPAPTPTATPIPEQPKATPEPFPEIKDEEVGPIYEVTFAWKFSLAWDAYSCSAKTIKKFATFELDRETYDDLITQGCIVEGIRQIRCNIGDNFIPNVGPNLCFVPVTPDRYNQYVDPVLSGFGDPTNQ